MADLPKNLCDTYVYSITYARNLNQRNVRE